MNKFLVASASAGILLLSACSDNTVVNDYEDAKPTAKVSFMVRDGVSGTGLDSVTIIQLDKDSATAASNADGFASFSDVKIGQYTFQISRPGYSTVIVNEAVLDIGNSEAPRVPDLNLNIMLPKAGATVSGRAFYTDISGGVRAAKSATVQLTLGHVDGFEWLNPVLSVTTDASGYYVFEELPAGVSYSIEVRQLVVEDIAYSTVTPVTVSGVEAGESKSAAIIDMAATGGAMRVISTNYWGNASVAAKDSIFIEFTEAVDVEQIEVGDIQVMASIDGASKELLVGTIWKNENKTLIIYPVDGKWWSDVNHFIQLGIKSVEGVSLAGFTGTAAQFSTASNVEPVGQASKITFTIGSVSTPDYGDSDFRLSWNSAKNAEGYQIWIKKGADSTYMLYTDDVSDTTLYVSSGTYFTDGNAVMFRVVAYNSKYVADPAKAPSLSVKDGVKPKVVSDDIGDQDYSFENLNNTSSKPDTLIDGIAIRFSEPLDTTVVPKITVPTALSSKATFVWVWGSNGKSATIYLVIKAGQDASTVTGAQAISIDMKGLKDLAGNLIDLSNLSASAFDATFQ